MSSLLLGPIFMRLQATHGVKGIFYCMDRKTKIPIAGFLDHIEISPKKKYWKGRDPNYFMAYLSSLHCFIPPHKIPWATAFLPAFQCFSWMQSGCD
jgi:hypothetical protein